LARTWGSPSGQPLRRPGGRQSVGGATFGGVFRPGRCRQHPDPHRRSNVRCRWFWPGWCSGPVGGSGSITGVGGVVWPGRYRRRPAWLWRNVCLGRGGMSLRGKWGKRSGVSTAIEIFEFFFSEMTCQNVIGGQKTLVLCHGLTKGAL